MTLNEKVAIVTGAASGIGRACAQRFVEEGATVLACDIDGGGLEKLAAEMGQGRLHTVLCDVTKRADAESSVEKALSVGGRLDCLVNSAGITPRTLPPDADFEARWDAVMEVNAKGVFLMSYAALEVMRPAGRGAIVNLVSVMSMVGYPTSLPFSDGFTAYPHSKGAVAQMTKEMGVRFAVEGVRINAVAPGFCVLAAHRECCWKPGSACGDEAAASDGADGAAGGGGGGGGVSGVGRGVVCDGECLAGGWGVYGSVEEMTSPWNHGLMPQPTN